MRKNKQKKIEAQTEAREYQTETSGLFFKIRKLLKSGSSEYQRIDVFENPDWGKVLLLDGLVQTTERDEYYYHEMLVHPAFIVHPEPKNVLIIGGGDGGVLREVLRYPVKKAVLVEIDEQVIQAASTHFPWLKPSLEDSRARLIVQDGRAFVEQTEDRFDVVIIDSSEPIGPSSPLHEKEFYERLKSRMNPGGIVTAQVASPFFQMDQIEKKHFFFKDLFKVARFYLGTVPTYPGGSWCYIFLSDSEDPMDIKRDPVPGLKVFNVETYRAAFALPNFMLDVLKKG
jgi:spermidine synthase